jgi:hypothetical protein
MPLSSRISQPNSISVLLAAGKPTCSQVRVGPIFLAKGFRSAIKRLLAPHLDRALPLQMPRT